MIPFEKAALCKVIFLRVLWENKTGDMKCPYCESQDIRVYIDRENDLQWYLCWNCKYQGYDLNLFRDFCADNNAWTADVNSIEEIRVKKKSRFL